VNAFFKKQIAAWDPDFFFIERTSTAVVQARAYVVLKDFRVVSDFVGRLDDILKEDLEYIIQAPGRLRRIDQ
jgi:hypothetical protein